MPPRWRKVCSASQASGKASSPLCTTPQMSERTTSTPSTRSRSRSAKRSAVMASEAGQPGPAARRASAALPVARVAGSTAGLAMGAVLLEPLGVPDSLFGSRPAGSRCPLGPQRPRRRKQESLAEPHVVVEQIDHRAFALDPLGDQVDAEAAEQVGKVGRVDVGGRALTLGSSSSAAGTLMKRTPRSASSRGSIRRSVTWSIEKR